VSTGVYVENLPIGAARVQPAFDAPRAARPVWKDGTLPGVMAGPRPAPVAREGSVAHSGHEQSVLTY
jgi:hypothetical protein